LKKNLFKSAAFRQGHRLFWLKAIDLTLYCAVLLFSWFLLSCDSQQKESYSPAYTSTPNVKQAVLIFGVHPLHNPQRLFATYGPLVEYLNRHFPEFTIQLEASRSYDEFDKKLYSRHFHFALPNPYQTINAMEHGYHVFAKMGEDENFRGVILVRKDSGISNIADLKGKTISFPAPTALAATMMPLDYLHSHGLDVNKDITLLFSGSQESSIMNVYLGKSAAGATWPPPWLAFVEQNPDIAAELEVKWKTTSLVNNSLVARDDVPPEVVSRMRTLFLALHIHDEGLQLLAALPLSCFEEATDASYQPVRDFMKKYSETIHYIH
jgi:phosphonate transport system substrate-binding protein